MLHLIFMFCVLMLGLMALNWVLKWAAILRRKPKPYDSSDRFGDQDEG